MKKLQIFILTKITNYPVYVINMAQIKVYNLKKNILQ